MIVFLQICHLFAESKVLDANNTLSVRHNLVEYEGRVKLSLFCDLNKRLGGKRIEIRDCLRVPDLIGTFFWQDWFTECNRQSFFCGPDVQDVLLAKPVEFVLATLNGTHLASFNREVQGIKSVLSVVNAWRKACHDHCLAEKGVGFPSEDV